ncbi:MAG: ABC transporter permease [Chloroflexota bacterium]|nr:ABC transporter permease [Chloroflexota bacterium]
MTAVWIFARLTLREASRSRLLALAAGLTLLFLMLLAWGVHTLDTQASYDNPLDRAVGMAAIDLLSFFVASFMVAVLAVFVCGASTHSDGESGLLQAILARPVRRMELLAGKWLGSAILLALYVVLLSLGISGIVWVASGYLPPHLSEAEALLFLEALVMLSLRLFFGVFLSNMPSGILPLMLYGLAWMGGLVELIGQQLRVSALVTAGIVSSLLMPTDILWRGASYFLQPPEIAIAARAVRGIPFVGQQPIAAPMVLWAVLYVALIFALGSAIFARRDV